MGNGGTLTIGGQSSIVMRTATNNVFSLNSHGSIQQQSIGGSISYFKGSSEYIFGSNASAPNQGGHEANFQIHHGKSRATASINAFYNNAGGPILQFISSRSNTIGTLGTKCQSNDYLADLRFWGDNGTVNGTLAQGASIWCRAKSTPADGDTSIAAELNFALGSGNNSGVYDTVKMQSDGKLRYGVQQHSTPHAVQARTFSLYPNNGGQNMTRFTFTGLVSGCYLSLIHI